MNRTCDIEGVTLPSVKSGDVSEGDFDLTGVQELPFATLIARVRQEATRPGLVQGVQQVCNQRKALNSRLLANRQNQRFTKSHLLRHGLPTKANQGCQADVVSRSVPEPNSKQGVRNGDSSLKVLIYSHIAVDQK